MTATAAGKTGLARRYATALFALAEAEKVSARIASDLAEFMALVAETPALARVFLDPTLPKSKVAKALSDILTKAGAHKITVKFVNVLTHNRRLLILADAEAAFRAKLAEKSGEMVVNVTSAKAMTAGQIKELEQVFSKSTGKKVTVEPEEDAEILGGLVVRMGSKMIDASVSGKLERLTQKQKQTLVA